MSSHSDKQCMYVWDTCLYFIFDIFYSTYDLFELTLIATTRYSTGGCANKYTEYPKGYEKLYIKYTLN